MTDFLSAALPWVIIGISVAIIAANSGRKKREAPANEQEDSASSQNTDSHDNYLPIGMCLGMCIGTVFGSTGVVPLSYGISFGMLIGTVTGICIKKR